MKYYLLLFFSFIFLGIQAQDLTKAERKALIKEIKLLKKSPEKYKFLKESSSAKDDIINIQNDAMAVLEKEKRIAAADYQTITDSLDVLTKSIEEFKQKGDCKLVNEGYKYRVQIGLYKNLDLTSLLANPKFMIHEISGGLNRYSIGNFNTLNEALLFKEEMRRLGLKDAFVTEYEDGGRVNINNDLNNTKKYTKDEVAQPSNPTSSKSATPLKVTNATNTTKVNTSSISNDEENTSSKEVDEAPLYNPSGPIISSPFYDKDEIEEPNLKNASVPENEKAKPIVKTIKPVTPTHNLTNTPVEETTSPNIETKEEVKTQVLSEPIEIKKDTLNNQKVDLKITAPEESEHTNSKEVVNPVVLPIKQTPEHIEIEVKETNPSIKATKEEVEIPITAEPLEIKKDTINNQKIDLKIKAPEANKVKKEVKTSLPATDIPSNPSKENPFKEDDEIEEIQLNERSSSTETSNENIKINIGSKNTTPKKTNLNKEEKVIKEASEPTQEPKIMIKIGG